MFDLPKAMFWQFLKNIKISFHAFLLAFSKHFWLVPRQKTPTNQNESSLF